MSRAAGVPLILVRRTRVSIAAVAAADTARLQQRRRRHSFQISMGSFGMVPWDTSTNAATTERRRRQRGADVANVNNGRKEEVAVSISYSCQ